MSEALALLQSWLGAAERLAARLPQLSDSLAAGSWPAAALAGMGGLALLVAGVRLGRLLTGAGGAMIGWLTGGLLSPQLAGWVPVWLPPWVAAAVFGVASFLAPKVYPVVLGLLPGTLLGLGSSLVGKAWVGGMAGGLVLALLALWLRRFVLAATAALLGSVLVALSLLALSHQVPLLLALARRPMLLVGLTATLAVAGTAFQLGTSTHRGRGRGPPPGKLEGIEDG